MRKPLLVTLSATMFAALLGPSPAAAQGLSSNEWPVQVLLGFSLAQLKLDFPDGLTNNGRTGLSAGISIGIPVTPRESVFGLRTQALISQRGATVSDGVVQQKIKTSYVDLMGLAEFRISPRINGERITLLFGPTFHITTSAQVVINTTGVDIDDVTENFDYGYFAGAEVRVVPKYVDVQVGWMPGFKKIFSEANNNARNQTLLILVKANLIR